MNGRERGIELFNKLYTQHQHEIYVHIYRSVLDRDKALDVTQDVFVKLWKSICNGNIDESFNIRVWLYVVAQHTLIDSYRRYLHKPGNVVPIESALDLEAPDDMTNTLQLREAVKRAFNSLAPEHKRILTLQYVSGYSTNELAAHDGVSRSLTNKRSLAARNYFRRAYEKQEVL